MVEFKLNSEHNVGINTIRGMPAKFVRLGGVLWSLDALISFVLKETGGLHLIQTRQKFSLINWFKERVL